MGCGTSKSAGSEVLTGAHIDDPDHPRGLSSGRLVSIEPGHENESALALEKELGVEAVPQAAQAQ